MAVKGRFEDVPLSASLPSPTGLAGALQLLPVRIPHAKPSTPVQNSEVMHNLSPSLPFPEIRLWECVCTCAHAKFQPKESFRPDLQPTEMILLWKQ